MLRLTQVVQTPELARLKIEGVITQTTLQILADELHRRLPDTQRIQLDFRDVVYLDAAGLELFRNLPQDRIEIVDCTPLIRELLSKELA
jgi:ABC-type transporter Mla MlaB component